MKKIIAVLVFAPLLGMCQVVQNGLVGYWPLDGNLNDKSNNSGNGVLVGGASYDSDRDTVANAAMTFDGTGTVEIADDDLYTFSNGSNDESFSISVWVNPNATSSHKGIVSKWNNTTLEREYNVYINATSEKLRFYVHNNLSSGSGEGRLLLETDNDLIVNQWQHVVCTYDGSQTIVGMKIFIDGVEVSTSPYLGGVGTPEATNYAANGMQNTSSKLRIGSYIGVSSFIQGFDGELDEVYLFDKALSTEEINALYTNTPLCTSCFFNVFEDSEQEIGIGTTQPQSNLHIVGEDAVLIVEDNEYNPVTSGLYAGSDFNGVSILLKGDGSPTPRDYKIGTAYGPGYGDGLKIKDIHTGEGLYLYHDEGIIFGQTTQSSPYNIFQLGKFYFDDKLYAPTIQSGPNFRVYDNGNVGIGLSPTNITPHALLEIDDKANIETNLTNDVYSLIVNGKIGAAAINIDLDASDWGDYVFEEGYNLQSLQEVEAYIENNGHLPNIPSAETLAESGLDLAKTAELQMVKIEELTLYLIELQKQLLEQQKQLDSYKKQLEK